MKLKSLHLVLIVLFYAIFLTSCAEVQHIEPCVVGHTYGFWGGLWHGMIAPFTFVIGLFDAHVVVWAVNNNGSWYTFGFLLGIGSLGFGGSRASR